MIIRKATKLIGGNENETSRTNIFRGLLDEGKQIYSRYSHYLSDLGFPVKILWRYLKKWNDMGFYEYGVSMDLGWFYIDKLPVEYAMMYEEVQQYVRNTKP